MKLSAVEGLWLNEERGTVQIVLTEFGIPNFKMCLNKTYSKIHIGKNVSVAFPIQNGLK
jgi:hypothetical protein